MDTNKLTPTLENFLRNVVTEEDKNLSKERVEQIVTQVKANHSELKDRWNTNMFTFSFEFYNTVFYFFVSETRQILTEGNND